MGRERSRAAVRGSRGSGQGGPEGRAAVQKTQAGRQAERKKKQARRKRQIRRRMRLLVLAGAVLLLLFLAVRFGPGQRTAETFSYSAELRAAKRSPQWQEIFDHAEKYPQALLDDLERNPELLDFAAGYLTAAGTAQGGFTQEELSSDCPLLLQWDGRWGYVPYGSSNIGISGCGPTCLSMLLFHFTRDSSLTPDALARTAQEGGYYIEGQGTAWSLMTDAAAWYGLTVSQGLCPEEGQMKGSLDEGALLICSVGPGDFTDSGHFILVTGYEEGGFTVNDPFSRRNSARLWPYDTLAPQIVQAWTYRR